MIKRIPQSVGVIESAGENVFFVRLSHILSAPYGKEPYEQEKTKRLISRCMRDGHHSILEHCSVTLECTTNIATYKDYTRHRHCAFTIESTSFCKYDDDTFRVITCNALSNAEEDALTEIMKIYRAHGKHIKVARDFLPQCCAARMLMTANVRELRHIIAVRGDPNDNPLTRELRDKIWLALNCQYPFFFPIQNGFQPRPVGERTIYNAWGGKDMAVLGGPEYV